MASGCKQLWCWQEAQRAIKQGRGYQQTIHDLQAALREVQESQKRASLDSSQTALGTPRGLAAGAREPSGQLQMARSRSWQDMQAEMASTLQTRDSLQGELASLQTEHSALQVGLAAALGLVFRSCLGQGC